MLLKYIRRQETIVSVKHCPSARCTYAAYVVGKDLDIFAVAADFLHHTFYFLIFYKLIFYNTVRCML
jgi:hypothetical protein